MIRYFFILLVFSNLLISCGSKDGGGNETPTPEKTSLLLPIDNYGCNTSALTFEWEVSKNTQSYELVLHNGKTNTDLSYTTEKTQYTVSFTEAGPYSWYIKSINKEKTSSSASRQFYNAGDVWHYIPYPAVLNSPLNESTISLPFTFNWTGSDKDNDITSYELFIDGKLQELNSLTSSEFTLSSIAAGTHTWNINTLDAQGHKSTSSTYRFTVE